jgi:aspartate dehydrogenase
MSETEPTLRVAVGSIGTVGLALARRLAQGVEGLSLAAVSARDTGRARARMADIAPQIPVLPLEELAARAEVVVECAPAACFGAIARPALEAGRWFVPISVGALLSHWDLVELARARGAKILVPSGAIAGLDVLRAAAEGRIERVSMTTRKPPGGLAGAPYLVQRGIELEGLDEPLRVFEGTAREGAVGFPANVNVAAAVALAGIGPDRTRLEVWADPGVTRNTILIENVPSEENPRTGRIVAQSVIAALRRLTAPLTLGT